IAVGDKRSGGVLVDDERHKAVLLFAQLALAGLQGSMGHDDDLRLAALLLLPDVGAFTVKRALPHHFVAVLVGPARPAHAAGNIVHEAGNGADGAGAGTHGRKPPGIGIVSAAGVLGLAAPQNNDL